MPDTNVPDLSLDDEREDHIDNGQVQVEPGQAWAEACELECGDSHRSYHLEIRHEDVLSEATVDAALASAMAQARSEILAATTRPDVEPDPGDAGQEA